MMHTVQIGQRPIAIMNASFDEAKRWFTSETFRRQASALHDSSGPSWDDGELQVRPASEDEIDLWNAARAAGDADEEDKTGYFVFLSPPPQSSEIRRDAGKARRLLAAVA